MPSPSLFFNTINSYRSLAALRSALELGLFGALGRGITRVSDLAQICSTSERGMGILCDFLVVAGFLTKTGQDYALTQDSAIFLDPDSPEYLGGVGEFLLSPLILEAFSNLTTAVRQGTTALGPGGTVAPEHPVWIRFARAMMPVMAPLARAIADLVPYVPDQPLKILDIAASHGLFGLEFARRYPQATVVAVDWPQVLTVAQENAQSQGLLERYQLLPGSAFEVDFGQNYDLVLVTNFLHHFTPAECIDFLNKVRTCLGPQGRVLTLEIIPNEDRVSPPEAAAFSLVMLATTPQGNAYSFVQYQDMFSQAGFGQCTLHPLPDIQQRLIIARL